MKNHFYTEQCVCDTSARHTVCYTTLNYIWWNCHCLPTSWSQLCSQELQDKHTIPAILAYPSNMGTSSTYNYRYARGLQTNLTISAWLDLLNVQKRCPLCSQHRPSHTPLTPHLETISINRINAAVSGQSEMFESVTPLSSVLVRTTPQVPGITAIWTCPLKT